MILEFRCPDCTLHGTFESFKRDEEAESLELCPSCGSDALRVDEVLGEIEAEVLSDEGVVT